MSVETVFSGEFLLEGFMQAPVAMAVFDAHNYRVRFANHQYRHMVDRTEDQLIGRPLFEIFPEAVVGKPLLDEVLKTGKPYSGNEVETNIRRNGIIERASFNITYQPLKSKNNVVEGIMLVATEVTALVRSKQALQDSEGKFRMMVSQSPIAMAILRGSDLHIELANDVILNGYWARSWDEIQGKRLLDIFPELRGSDIEALLAKAYATGTRQCEKERPVIIHNSPCSFVDLDFRPFFNPDNTVSGILLTVYDVSEKVMVRRRTEESETRLRMVIDASGLGTWDLNLKTGEFNYSEKYLATFGTTERLSHEQLLQRMHPDDLIVRKNAFQEAVRTGRLHYVSRLVWSDDSIHWIEAHGKVLYDSNGEAIKMIGTSRDLTEEKRHQQTIKESEERFRLLASTMPQFIWTGDANGNLDYFNQSVFDYCGMTFGQLQGQGWIDMVHPDDRAGNIVKWKEAVKTGSEFLFEHRFRRHDGQYRWQLSRALPQFDSNGKVQMWVGTSTDIHDQKTFAKELEEKVHERTKELKQTNEALEKTNRELEQFAYIASHDLQEPLRKIQTFADLVKRNIHDEVSVQKYFSKIDSSAQRMGDLIRSVLEYSRIPAHPGQLTLTDLNEVVDQVISDHELTILEKGALVERNHLPAIPGMRLQIQQLFGNLIGNSLKFCKESPCIRVTGKAVPGFVLTDLFDADPDKQYVELRFSDNGIGFDTRYRDQIFTIFQRLHGWQQYSGTGIGLALCKKIVENHQGHISAESVPGKGSTFIVYLPS